MSALVVRVSGTETVEAAMTGWRFSAHGSSSAVADANFGGSDRLWLTIT